MMEREIFEHVMGYRECRFQGWKTVVQVEAGEFSSLLLVCPDLLLQRMVVHKPTGMDVLHEERDLLPRWIHPILVGLKHTNIIERYNIISFYVTIETITEGRLCFHPQPEDRGLPAPPPSPLQDKNIDICLENWLF